jgi:hypothetical protein
MVQPARAPTGLPYGEHQALMQQQASVPLPNSTDRLQSGIDAAQASPLGPGDHLAQPTAIPQEPVTAGLPIGPGPGTEAVPAPMVPQNPDSAALLKFLPMLEALADQPTATYATRNFVRRVRGSIPAQLNMQNLVGQNPPNQQPAPNQPAPGQPPPPA